MWRHDTAIFTMVYLILLILWFHKIFKLIFLRQSSWPKKMDAEYLEKKTSMDNFLEKFSYTFSTTYLWSNYEQLLNWICYCVSKNKFQPVILSFYFDLVLPFYFLKRNRFFSTFRPVPCESRQYFSYLLLREVCTNLQIKRFPLTKL